MGKGTANVVQPVTPAPETITSSPPQPQTQISASDLAALFTPDVYRCTLSKQLQELAVGMLREEEGQRTLMLAQLRSRIRNADYITDCRLDSNFLLRFLRINKFKVTPAFEMLIAYIKMRHFNPIWFHGLNLADTMILDLIDRGAIFAVPERDEYGRRVIFTIGGHIDPMRHTSDDVMRAIMLVFECLMESEETQIRGVAHVLDESGVRFAHLRLFRRSFFKQMFTACKKALPIRHRSIQLVSVHPVLFFFYEYISRHFISAKMNNRIRLHCEPQDLLGHVDRRILPAEYGGSVPMRQMIDEFKKEISADVVARISTLDLLHIDMNRMRQQLGKNNPLMPANKTKQEQKN